MLGCTCALHVETHNGIKPWVQPWLQPCMCEQKQILFPTSLVRPRGKAHMSMSLDSIWSHLANNPPLRRHCNPHTTTCSPTIPAPRTGRPALTGKHDSVLGQMHSHPCSDTCIHSPCTSHKTPWQGVPAQMTARTFCTTPCFSDCIHWGCIPHTNCSPAALQVVPRLL